MTAPIASSWSEIAGWVSHPLENAAFARRTSNPDIQCKFLYVLKVLISAILLNHGYYPGCSASHSSSITSASSSAFS
jgi:hypothetical protein